MSPARWSVAASSGGEPEAPSRRLSDDCDPRRVTDGVGRPDVREVGDRQADRVELVRREPPRDPGSADRTASQAGSDSSLDSSRGAGRQVIGESGS